MHLKSNANSFFSINDNNYCLVFHNIQNNELQNKGFKKTLNMFPVFSDQVHTVNVKTKF